MFGIEIILFGSCLLYCNTNNILFILIHLNYTLYNNSIIIINNINKYTFTNLLYFI